MTYAKLFAQFGDGVECEHGETAFHFAIATIGKLDAEIFSLGCEVEARVRLDAVRVQRDARAEEPLLLFGPP